jgi:hypothetical protein
MSDPFRSYPGLRAIRLFGIAAVYVIACRVMLAPICNFKALGTSIYEGDARLVAWALAWDNHAVLTSAPLFDANIFFPAQNALAYGEHFFGISLFSLPVYLLTHNTALGYNLVWILSYVLCAAAVHYVTWRLTSDHLASMLAALAYAFSFFRMHHGHGHLHLIWTFWIPVSLVTIERWVSTQSWRAMALVIVVVVLQALSSWYQAVMVFVAGALLVAWLLGIRPLLDTDGRIGAARARRLAIQAAVGAGLMLVLVWPFARHYHALASGGPIEASAASADVAGLLMPPENTLLGQWLLQKGVKGPRWIWGELTIYVGWVTLVLAAAGALVAARGRTAKWRGFRYFILLAAVTLALAFGPNAREVADNAWHWSPFGLLARIPGADLFRAPARFASLLTLSLSVLAGAASARLNEKLGAVGRVISGILIPLILLDSYVVNFPGGMPKPFPIPLVYRRLGALPAGPVVSLPDYADTAEWFREPDYQYFSTAHWYPIANGYSRAAPPAFTARMGRYASFPDVSALQALRESGIRYVVVHANDYPGGADAVRRASADVRLRLVAQSGTLYAFQVAE